MSLKFMFCAQNTQAVADSSWKNIQYPMAGVDLGGIPSSWAPQIFRRNTTFAGTVIRPDYQLLPRFGDPILGLASLDWPVPTCLNG